MKKRILSLVLCAVMLLSMCLFMGAGVTADTADTVDTTETADAAETANIVSFTNAGPLVKPEQTAGPARARALAANDNGSGVQLDKTVSDNQDGTYTVRLEAYATGAQTTTVSTKPCDIVLVLDVSGSMAKGKGQMGQGYAVCAGWDNTTYKNYDGKVYLLENGVYREVTVTASGYYPYYTYTYRIKETGKEILVSDGKYEIPAALNGRLYTYGNLSKLDALKNAVNTFIDQVAAKETGTVKHNISIVKFAGDKKDEVGDDTYYGGTYNYSQIVMGLTDAKANQKALKDAVNDLEAGGATSADYGMEHAQSILSKRPADRKDATKVVVMFTDGEPNHDNGFDSDVADSTISAAKSLKDGGATVYTVGCMKDANATRVTDWNGVKDVNKYMHLVSSNYKDATEMSKPGDATYPEDTSKSYYLIANDADDLKNVFESISSQVGGAGNTTLTDRSILKDAVTPYFEIPAGAKVTLKTADCTDVNSDGTLKFINENEIMDGSVTATVSRETNTVSVIGFDYKTNWCGSHSGKYSGKKLIVEFQIKPTADFLGGEDVQTNVGKDDGIYAPGETTPVEKFQPQQVDVPVKAVNPEATGTEIYLGEKTDLADRVTTNIPQLNCVNNAYVDVTYTVTDENGQLVGTYTVPAGKTSSEGAWAWTNGSNVKPDKTTTYTVTSTSTPKTGNMANTASVEKQFTITVKTCSLKITKTVTGGGDPNQTFVFNVMKGNDLVATVVLKAGQSTTITGLAVGDYTVVEDTAWSWRYRAENGGEAAVKLDKSHNYYGEAGITNTYVKHDWLTSIVDVINKWTAKDNIDNTGHVPGSGTN